MVSKYAHFDDITIKVTKRHHLQGLLNGILHNHRDHFLFRHFQRVKK